MSLSPDQSMPAKSAASQPLVTGSRGGSRLMSTGITLPVTSPYPVPVKAPVSYVAVPPAQLLEQRAAART